MKEDIKLMKGNEAIAHAAIRYGADGYFGYPITPQSEVMETLMEEKPWETTGMVVLQAESEVAAINMVYGGASCGKAVMTSSSSPGVSLKQEGISYLAGAELPCLIVNVMRGGPGLGTIQPSQADYFQAVKGGGHGDYHLIALAPASVQEMADFVALGFDLAFKYRNPAIILADGIIGQMMEKVVLPPFRKRRTEEEIREQNPWATLGKTKNRKRNVITSLELDPAIMEQNNIRFQSTYKRISENEVRFEEINCENADYLIVAFGSMYMPKDNRAGSRRRYQNRIVETHHAMAVPDGSYRSPCKSCERNPIGRVECRTNGRRRSIGCQRKSASRTFRTLGRNRTYPRRSS